MVLPVSKSALL